MAMPKTTCTIEGCGRVHYGQGYCLRHYRRWYRHGDPYAGGTPAGVLDAFLDEAAKYTGDDCLRWPFGLSPRGYGQCCFNKRRYGAHRVVCERAHGPRPTPRHQAAHLCGKGHEACVNPRHLAWKTPLENTADKYVHGTILRGEKSPNAKLKEADVMEIRRQAGAVAPEQLASRFGVAVKTIKSVQAGRAWSWLPMPSVASAIRNGEHG